MTGPLEDLSPRTGGQVLVAQLLRHDVRRAFCVPGESYLPVLDALHDAPIELVVCRQEGGAAYMAEAQGKLTSRPGVVFVTRGPGASNAMAGVHTAYQDATPMVVFVGLVPRAHRDRRAFQEIDLRGLFGSVTKLVETVDDAARMPEHVARAFAVASSGRPGPVVLGLPEDMLSDVVDVPDADPIPVAEGAVGEEDLDRLARLLAAARRPLVLLGGNRWTEEAARDVREWAERWALPVVTDFRCQDHIDNDSPAFAGPVQFARDERLARLFAESDLLITVGTTLGDVATDGFESIGPPAPLPLVQVTPYADLTGTAYRPRLVVLAAPASFGAAVRKLSPSAPPPWQGRTAAAHEAYLRYRTPAPDGDEPDLGVVYATLAARLPDDALVTCGAGNYAIWPQRFLVYRRFPSQLAPRNGSMGYSVPSGVAAALEYPHRTVLTVAGDGCFLMNGQELATAVAAGTRLIVIVVNNGMYGTIRMHQERDYPGRVVGTGLGAVDFAAYARAMGASGETVTRTEEFGPALDRALRADRPALIELRVTSGRLAPGRTIDDVRAAGRQAG
ncbi:MAG TPA: thiamine pyrophosphate-dependent enzyme [Streptosporangiaceae bacterium]|nr:thiamine pyrophosphate-dependent enzyme [Streptosporangiaceae bacterium]